MGLPEIHSRSSNGTPLYKRLCEGCGKPLIGDKRKLGKPCLPCALKARRTHGLAAGGKLHPLYKLLNNIRARCEYPSSTNYAYYGGRGITVCEEWRQNPLTFIAWAESQGWKTGLEVDRIDANGDYSPENCRLLTHQENSQRTRRIKTTPEQVATVRSHLSQGSTVKQAASAAGVGYMVAWHIKNSPGVWSNV